MRSTPVSTGGESAVTDTTSNHERRKKDSDDTHRDTSKEITSDALSHWDRYSEGWEQQDPDAVMAAFAPRGYIMDPTLDEPMTGEEIGDWVEETVTGFPDIRFEDHRVLTTDEEGVLIVEWTMHGTHTGFFEGLPPTDNEIALDGVDIVTVSDDGIESIRIYFDQSTIAEQLGLTFPALIGQLPKLAAGAVRSVF